MMKVIIENQSKGLKVGDFVLNTNTGLLSIVVEDNQDKDIYRFKLKLLTEVNSARISSDSLEGLMEKINQLGDIYRIFSQDEYDIVFRKK